MNTTLGSTSYGVPTIAGTGQGLGESQNSAKNDCLDSDGDGIPNYADLDDDNDGILDAIESPNCFFTATEAGFISSVRSSFNPSAGATIPNLYDNNTASVFNFTAGQTVNVNDALLTIEYPVAVPLNSLTVTQANLGLMTIGGASRFAKLYGSVDGVDYTVLSAAAGGIRVDNASTTTAKIFTNATPAVSYKYYQIRYIGTSTTGNAVNGTIGTGNINEIESSFNIAAYIPSANQKPGVCSADLDGDGIPNHLDLDSDGDGCTDALEGGANFTTANFVTATGSIATQTPNQNLGNAVNTTVGSASYGVPTIAGAGQSIGDSQNNLLNECRDSDGDGVPDIIDLDDDDNDGILDTDECPSSNNLTNGVFPTTGDNTNTLPGWTVGGTYAASGPWASPVGRVNLNANGLEFRRDAATTTTISQSIFGVGAGATINLNNLYWFRSSQANATGGFNFTVSYAGTVYATINSTTVTNTTAPTVTANNGASVNLGVLPNVATNATISGKVNLAITLPTTGLPSSGELLLTYTAGTSATEVRDLGMQSISLNSTICRDTDGDGIPDYLDLDSDGDGCTDAIEGGAAFTTANLVTAMGAISTQTPNQNLGNTVGNTATTLGVPSIAGAGQSIGRSQNSSQNDCLDSDGDGVPNWQDLDDDNDGILDTAEGFCETQSVYTMNMASTLASANSSFNANGAVFNLVYNLTSGTAVAGLGTTFSIPFTYSDFNNTTSLVDHRWEGFNSNGNRLHIRPVTLPLYTNLPANNSTNESYNLAQTPDWNFKNWINTGAIDKLGTFTTTIGNIPAVSNPSINSISSSPIILYSSWNVGGSAIASGGYYGAMQIQPVPESGDFASTADYNATYGQSYIWDYTAFNSAPASNFPSNAGDRGLITITQNSIIVCNHRDTDGDGIPDYLDLDSDGDGCPDAIEGGATFTTANLVTATGTIATQTPNQNLGNTVGNTAPTLGVPTIAGAGQSIGNAQAFSRNDCLDSDGDGIPDWQDVDDDNDGILDTAENECLNAIFAGYPTTITPLSSTDFGRPFTTGVAQNDLNLTADLSHKYGYPVNSGAVIVRIYNAHVHPTANEFYLRGDLPTTRWEITGSVASIFGVEQGSDYYPDQLRSINMLDNAPISVMHTTTAPGSWTNTSVGNVYTLQNLTGMRQVDTGVLHYANSEFNTSKRFEVSTNESGPSRWSTYFIRIQPECDTDKDSIPNRLDLDSDGDGCSDALEGGATISTTQLLTAGGTLSGGSTSVNQNICTTCVSTGGANIGLPQFSAPIPAGYSNATGQAIGDSQNEAVGSCYCTQPPAAGTGEITKVGISVQQKQEGWPQNIPNGHIVLESKEKGFVITRVAHVSFVPQATDSIATPFAGMLVYDIQDACVKLFNGINWKCLERSCNTASN